MSCVYIITHPHTGVFYIGQSGNFSNRRLSHLKMLRGNSHHASLLQEAWNIEQHLTWEQIPCETVEQAVALERDMIVARKENPLLANSRMAREFTPEARQNMAIGIKQSWTPERKKQRSIKMTGSVHTAATIEKMRASAKGFSEGVNRKAAEKRRIQIEIDGTVYRTAQIAARETGWDIVTVLKRARSEKPEWRSWKIVDKE